MDAPVATGFNDESYPNELGKILGRSLGSGVRRKNAALTALNSRKKL
jgi:hypothetical protein